MIYGEHGGGGEIVEMLRGSVGWVRGGEKTSCMVNVVEKKETDLQNTQFNIMRDDKFSAMVG